MYIILWEYLVKAEKTAEFERNYCSNGRWAELFRKSPGYLGTELVRDEKEPLHYLTVDRWDSKGSYEAFQAKWENEYHALDAECEGLTESEYLLGKWVS